MSEGGSWIAETVAEAKSEWGIKSLASFGIWILGPITGEISFDSIVLIIQLLSLTLFTVALNVAYQDILRPLTPAANPEEYFEEEADESADVEGEADAEREREVSTETA